MPSWLVAILALLLGSGGLATFITLFLSDRLQQRRERERKKGEARAEWIRRQRQMCLDLLEAVINHRGLIRTLRSIHDDRASRPVAARKQMQLAIQQLPSFGDTVRRFRRQFDLEPNAQLQGAIEHWGDAGIAYAEVLMSAMYSPWNPVKWFLGKAPKETVDRLADDFDARTHELQDAVREYMASLETKPTTTSGKPASRLPRIAWMRGLMKH